MTRVLLTFLTFMAISLPSFGNSSIVDSLVKRENIQGVRVTYLDSKTQDFFENKIQWGSKLWPSKKNPFGKNAMMDLKNFLETFDLLIPTGTYNGSRSNSTNCKAIYNVSGGHFYSRVSVCTVKYTKYNSVWSLKMMVDINSWGTVFEDASISSDFFVGLSVE